MARKKVEQMGADELLDMISWMECRIRYMKWLLHDRFPEFPMGGVK